MHMTCHLSIGTWSLGPQTSLKPNFVIRTQFPISYMRLFFFFFFLKSRTQECGVINTHLFMWCLLNDTSTKNECVQPRYIITCTNNLTCIPTPPTITRVYVKSISTWQRNSLLLGTTQVKWTLRMLIYFVCTPRLYFLASYMLPFWGHSSQIKGRGEPKNLSLV